MNLQVDSEGFTLVELLLAMTVFVAVMVIATTGFIGMNRSFSRGLIRKELSESTQFISEDATRSLRSQGSNVVIQDCSISIGGDGCFEGWSSLCFGQVRYAWQAEGSLYRDSSSCDQPPSDTKVEILSGRYKAQRFEITRIPDSSSLFRIRGLFSTIEADALKLNNEEDPYSLSCKGTSESSSVGSCAVERFSFIVNIGKAQ